MGGISRPGIVHRLDKDTSGLLVVAKKEEALCSLSQQFKSRKVKKQYLALVQGEVSQDRGEIEVPIGRHSKDRKKMGVRTGKARAAMTRYLVKERFPGFTLLEVAPETGRTHQIRVHMAYVSHPILGDPVYGGRKRRERSKGLGMDIVARRQMLHAWRLGLAHPQTGEYRIFEAPLPSDFQEILGILRSRRREIEREAGGEGNRRILERWQRR
jgi:23S rRNA pseudouridine1911/1915/1917 synthase